MSAIVRSLVSKKKRRFLEDGFDLDLTYITERIIAMGYPAENVEGMYRNNMADVVRFLDGKHPERYKVYNLCSERVYDKAKFHGRVSHYPFEDHNAPPIELMRPFCQDVEQWLAQHPQNVVAVHCKAGKGRTGVMICAFLLHASLKSSATEALAFYGEARTKNSKGVTIPSQARYVRYYEELLKTRVSYVPKTLLLTAVVLHTVPKFNKDGSCNFVFTVKMKNVKIYTSKPQLVTAPAPSSTKLPAARQIRLPLQRPLPICGDIKVEFFHKQSLTKEKMCHFWFNTFFINSSRRLVLPKEEIDKAHKDKKVFDADFQIEMEFVDLDLNTASEPTSPTSMYPIPSPPFAATGRNSEQEWMEGADGTASEIDEDDFEYDVGDIEDRDSHDEVQ